MRPPNNTPPRSGMTLVELLVVVGILMLLTVVLVPRLQPATEQRAVREAARSVNAYLCAARNEAIASGRPVGVIFHRGFRRKDPTDPTKLGAPEQPGVCVRMEQLEMPKAFGGMTDDAVVRVQDWTRSPTGTNDFYWKPPYPPYIEDHRYGWIVLKAQVRFDHTKNRITDFENGTIRYGDQIQLGGKGPWYTIVRDNPGFTESKSSLYADFPPDSNGYLQFDGGGGNAPVDDNDLDNNGNSDGWVDNYWLTLVRDPGSIARLPYRLVPSAPGYFPCGPFSSPLSFRIRPQPFKDAADFDTNPFAALASVADTLELPRQTAIDLTFSGFDTTSRNFLPAANDETPIVLMFSPTGSVMGVYTHEPPTATEPTPKFDFICNPESIHFLVGSLDKATDDDGDGLPDGGEEQRYNVEDQNNFWVSINPQSGNVITTGVADGADPTDPAAASTPFRDLNDTDKENSYVRRSRGLARQSRAMGGR